MPETTHERIDRLRGAQLKNRNLIETFREYARGEQPCTLSSDMRRTLLGIAVDRFCDNICDKIVATVAARAELKGFSIDLGKKEADPEQDAGAQAVMQYLYEFGIKNRLSRKQYDAHYGTARDGNFAALLDWKITERNIDRDPTSGRVTMALEPWWNGREGSWVCYTDLDSEPEFGVKEWIIPDPMLPSSSKKTVTRRNIYFADRIERFARRGKTWDAWDGSGTGQQVQPVSAWEKADGSPLGVPMIHFANQKASAMPAYGMSDLDGGILGIQDQINDIHWDIIAAARASGFQILYVTGFDAEPDPDNPGEDKPLYIGPGYVITTDDPQSKVGAVPAGEMTRLIEVLDAKKAAAASTTRTPEYVITGGNWPSGLALIQARRPSIDKTEQFTRTVGPSWSTLMHRATEISNTWGGTDLDEALMIKPDFADPEGLDPASKADAQKTIVEALQAVDSLQDAVLLRKTGMLTEGEIQELLASRKVRAEEQLAAMAAVGGPGTDFGGNTSE